MPNCLYLYLPYLHFDTYRSMVKRRKLILERRKHGRAKPVPQTVAQQESLELKMIWEYIGYDPPLNCRRTLDQFGHHSLRDTTSRDDDQMLYKLTKKDSSLPWSESSDNSSTRTLLETKGSDMGSRDGSVGDLLAESEVELRDGYVLMVDQLWLWSIDTSMRTEKPGCGADVLIVDSHPDHFLRKAGVVSDRRHALPTGRPTE